ncbi:histidine kinase [Paenibacillus sp. LHD-117]|uniref:sensor histidine kinase n=1 Tax=Paenibacillus sp. LHD-117 TaxID=3071412 RepID=UPI0027DEC446|nr:histidine kinase [Paenibacillus sp. LHD-117]MDQ6419497.1 histidine kinase [Paenibacillus sp. LHD-117]
MKVFRRYRYMPFGYKLMLSYCLFIVIPVIVIGYFANSIYIKSIREQIESSVNGTLIQISDNVSYKIEDIIRVSDFLYYDNTLARHLRNYEKGWVAYEATVNLLLPKFEAYKQASSLKMWQSIYIKNEEFPEIYFNYKGNDPLRSETSRYDVYHLKRILDKDWYSDYPDEVFGMTMQWKQVEDDAKFNRISHLRRLVDVQVVGTNREIGFLRQSLHLSELFQTVDFNKIGNDAAIYVKDDAGRVMLTSGEAEFRYGDVWDEEAFGENLVIAKVIPKLNWSIAAVIPNETFEKKINEVRLLTFAICLVFTIVYFISGALLSNYFSRKVGKIVSVLDSFQEGNFHKRINFKGNDEFSQISLALNEMGQNIGELIHKVYVADLDKKEAELDMLQAQINPHFLYNTLSSINRLAKFGELDKLQRMVMDLAKFYRLSLNEGRILLPISDELEQANAYINIQKIKYEERMGVSFDIDPAILKYGTIKLIIQPFIENVLEHAWCADRIHIRIVGELEDDNTVLFKIIDDGVGISQELLQQMDDPEESTSVGYGIRNVNQRIKLYYGQAYGVRIFSRLGIGTTVCIRIPAEEAREGR